jgi:cyclopropane fatty-acyl-phospholipid synthase-like methyltransferase
MLNREGRKTDQTHWDDIWSNKRSMRLPTGVFVGTANIYRLLKSYVSPGMRVLEIGCAPGKMLAWVAMALQARVSLGCRELTTQDRG